MIIKVENINKQFNESVVLENVNMEFKSGTIYGLIGKNGSGKSVFLKILCGFYKMDSGRVFIDNQDIFKLNDYLPNARCLIEKPNFLPELTGSENLSLLASIQNKISNQEILETLEKVCLTEHKDKKYKDYSLGMKQKLGIAQVLMENPRIIILDEPFNGVDSESIIKIRNILISEKKKGKIIIIATHNKEDIDLLADQIYTFDSGKVYK